MAIPDSLVSSTGSEGASCFSAHSQISLKGFKITEADSLPVKLLGAQQLCTATRRYLKELASACEEQEESPGSACPLPSQQTRRYMSNCQTFQRGRLPFQIIFKNCFYTIFYRPWSSGRGQPTKKGICTTIRPWTISCQTWAGPHGARQVTCGSSPAVGELRFQTPSTPVSQSCLFKHTQAFRLCYLVPFKQG